MLLNNLLIRTIFLSLTLYINYLLYICNLINNKEAQNMARPIKETPILYGPDGRRFEERMQNPPKVSPEKRAEIRRSYETVMKMMVN